MANTPYGNLHLGYSDPTRPPPQTDGGNWVWDALKGAWSFLKGNAGDILNTGANLVEGYMSSADRAKALEEQRREYDATLAQRKAEQQTGVDQFGRTTGDQEAQAAVRAQTQLNKAPVADKAQALILARMGVAPGKFQPRDYTQGQESLATSHAAPGASVADTMQHAAGAYTPGSGGVDTSVLKALIAKLTGSSGLNVERLTGPDQPPPPSFPIRKPYPITPSQMPVKPPTTFKPIAEPPEAPAPLTGTTDGSTDGGTDPNDPRTQLLRRMVGPAIY